MGPVTRFTLIDWISASDMFGIDTHSIFLLSAAVVSVIALIFMIAVVKLNPVITLLVTSLALAVVAGMPPTSVIRSFESGVGGTLGHIAVIVGLGTMLGKMMAESGASDRIAFTLIRVFGEKNVPWAMMTIALIVGLPAFFEVAFVLIVPILFTVARRTNTSLVLAGIPMVAGLSVVHGLVPPHPAATLAVTIYHADVGRTIFYALLIGIPTAIIAGPLYARLIAPHVHLSLENPMADQLAGHDESRNLPGFYGLLGKEKAKLSSLPHADKNGRKPDKPGLVQIKVTHFGLAKARGGSSC